VNIVAETTFMTRYFNVIVAEATFMTWYFNVIATWNWSRLGIFVGGEGNHFEWGLLT
jgi:hypothetical protein